MPHLRHRFRTGQEAWSSVFGNGTGFVWHGGGTQAKDVVKRALIVEMKAGLVTVHEAEGGVFGEILEGDRESRGTAGRRLHFRAAGFRWPGRGGDASGRRPSPPP